VVGEGVINQPEVPLVDTGVLIPVWRILASSKILQNVSSKILQNLLVSSKILQSLTVAPLTEVRWKGPFSDTDAVFGHRKLLGVKKHRLFVFHKKPKNNRKKASSKILQNFLQNPPKAKPLFLQNVLPPKSSKSFKTLQNFTLEHFGGFWRENSIFLCFPRELLAAAGCYSPLTRRMLLLLATCCVSLPPCAAACLLRLRALRLVARESTQLQFATASNLFWSILIPSCLLSSWSHAVFLYLVPYSWYSCSNCEYFLVSRNFLVGRQIF